jgi:cation transport regulator ChaC
VLVGQEYSYAFNVRSFIREGMVYLIREEDVDNTLKYLNVREIAGYETLHLDVHVPHLTEPLR